MAALILLVACGGSSGRDSGDGDSGVAGDAGTRSDARPGDVTVRDLARELALHVRGHGNLMIGVGNDNTGPYDHQVPIDLHYAYLVGYGDQGGWPTWNADGAYVSYFAQTAAGHHVTPMYIYYQLALELETGNDAVLADTARMHQYLLDQSLLFTRIAETDEPAVIVLEPDFFGYLMHRAADGAPPDAIVARVHHADLPQCADLPETAVGLTRCVLTLARAIAPKARIGFHASAWGAYYDALDPAADIESSGRAVGAFLRTMGADLSDFVAVETLDRDAGSVNDLRRQRWAVARQPGEILL